MGKRRPKLTVGGMVQRSRKFANVEQVAGLTGPNTMRRWEYEKGKEIHWVEPGGMDDPDSRPVGIGMLTPLQERNYRRRSNGPDLWPFLIMLAIVALTFIAGLLVRYFG